MTKVIEFPTDSVIVKGQAVKVPTVGAEYLFLCKRFLTIEDYEEVLLSIMDEEYYKDAEIQIKAIVDSYFSFP